MYIVLTRSWKNSWYNCFDTKEAAQECYRRNAHYYPNCWLIEGNILERETYSNIGIHDLPH